MYLINTIFAIKIGHWRNKYRRLISDNLTTKKMHMHIYIYIQQKNLTATTNTKTLAIKN